MLQRGRDLLRDRQYVHSAQLYDNGPFAGLDTVTNFTVANALMHHDPLQVAFAVSVPV
eukprot:SAG31_NODE_4074_length_3613_cov_2580.628628_4_plen_58_part_00